MSAAETTVVEVSVAEVGTSDLESADAAAAAEDAAAETASATALPAATAVTADFGCQVGDMDMDEFTSSFLTNITSCSSVSSPTDESSSSSSSSSSSQGALYVTSTTASNYPDVDAENSLADGALGVVQMANGEMSGESNGEANGDVNGEANGAVDDMLASSAFDLMSFSAINSGIISPSSSNANPMLAMMTSTSPSTLTSMPSFAFPEEMLCSPPHLPSSPEDPSPIHSRDAASDSDDPLRSLQSSTPISLTDPSDAADAVDAAESLVGGDSNSEQDSPELLR